jgi:hypothetical protein
MVDFQEEYSYRDKKLVDLTRDELIEALLEQFKMNEQRREMDKTTILFKNNCNNNSR